MRIIDYEFECTVVDKTTREPLSNVQVVDPNGDKALTNKKGFFKIEGEFTPGEDFQLIFKKSGNNPSYKTLNIPITTQAGSIRSNLNDPLLGAPCPFELFVLSINIRKVINK